MSDGNGTPCWYELSTTDLPAAGAFYGSVLGWTVVDSGMPGVTYHLASAGDGGMVAGLGGLDSSEKTPSWLIYFTAADVDAMVEQMTTAGASVVTAPADIPGTGRYATLADPRGAVFGLLQPLPMEEPTAQPAFDQQAVGHGNWHELLTVDPESDLGFYADTLGWTRGETMSMGEMGSYQLFAADGADIGGLMPLAGAPVASWVPYFGTDGVDAAVERITANGGTLHHGPADVPGGAYIAIATDPHGAWFAVVGPR